MLLTIGERFELEVQWGMLFIRVGDFERCYNNQGLPAGLQPGLIVQCPRD